LEIARIGRMLCAMAGEVRPYRALDRVRAVELLGDARALDSPSSRVHVLEVEGAVAGGAVLVLPDAGEEAYLGTIALTAPGDLNDVYDEPGVVECSYDRLAIVLA
jgi:hypothetical protein